MGKAYWSKSMVVSRLTGVPYRQNDLVLDAVNGRVLIRSLAVHGLTINEDKYVQLQCARDGRLLLRVIDDERGLLKQHPRFINGNVNGNGNKPEANATDTVAKKQRNMVLYARQQVRMACQKYKVKELRCKVKNVVRVSEREVVAELERVDDLAEMYGWGKRGRTP